MPDNPLAGLYPQPQVSKPLDPFQAIQAAGAVQAFQRNQLELGARKAIGDEYRNALSPEGLDVGKLLSGVKSNPAAAYGLPEATTHILGQQGTQFNNLAAQNRAVMDFIGSMAADPTLTKEKLYNEVATFGRAHHLPGNVMGPWLMGIPSDTAGVRNHVRTLANASRGAAGSAETVPFTDPATGQTINAPKGATMFAGGAGIPGALPAGLPAGGEESARTMQGDLTRARNFGQDIFPLHQALDAANDLKAKYGEGYFAPGAKARNEFQSMIYGFSPQLSRVLHIDPEKLRDFAKADKYMTQAMQSRASAFGSHTDSALATAVSGNPNVNVNDLTVDDVLKSTIALRRAEHAQTLSASKGGGPGYTQAAASWPAQNDVRAFALDLMSPEARAKLLGSIKKGTPEWRRFNNSLRSAYDSGIMSRPGGSNAAQP
jgi:hypothetical protein